MSVELTCHCGAIRLQLAEPPTEVTDCNCSICRRYGVLWAYYTKRQVKFASLPTDVYQWGKKTIAFHRCKTCGCLTHGMPTDDQTEERGINARLLEPAVLAKARVRPFDGADTFRYLDEKS